MSALRSLLYAAIFYPATVLWVLAGLVATLIGRKPTFAVVLSWASLHHWLARQVLGIRLRVDGDVPAGPTADRGEAPIDVRDARDGAHHEIADHRDEERTRRHSALRLDDPALWRHSGRAFGGSEGASDAGRGRQTGVASGRPVIIYPEGTRVRVGEAPALKSGFAALYRALGLAVVPVAVDSGRLWGRGFVHRERDDHVQDRRGDPAGLSRKDIEARVHAAINALESGAEARS